MKNNTSNRLIFPLIVLALISTACAFSFDLGGQPETIEPTATSPTVIPTPTSEPALPTAAFPGSISGKLSYPSEFIPPLRVVAFRVENGAWTQQYIYVDTILNASTYQIEGLEPGYYWITAYTIPNDNGAPSGLAGGYTQAVLCGLSVDCTDHSLIAIEVKPGMVTGNIDPGDWYAAEGSFLTNPAP